MINKESFQGRINRRPFIIYAFLLPILVSALMIPVLMGFFIPSGAIDRKFIEGNVTAELIAAFVNGMVFVAISPIYFKRMQDINYNGMIPIILYIIFFVSSVLQIIAPYLDEQIMQYRIAQYPDMVNYLSSNFSGDGIIFPLIKINSLILSFSAIILFLIILVLVFKKGTDGDNRFGSNPLQDKL